jgi:hypothetical protein
MMGDSSVECERAWLALLANRETAVPKRWGWNMRRTFEDGFAAGVRAARPRLYPADVELRSSGWHGGRA